MRWTGVRHTDDPTIEVRIWIDAPPERVRELVSDITLMPEAFAGPSTFWRCRLHPADGGTEVSHWVRLGPGRSGLALEHHMTATLRHIKNLAETT